MFYDCMEYVCFSLQSAIVYLSRDTELWGNEEGVNVF